MDDDMARIYLKSNGIVGAFKWDDRPEGWVVYLGTPDDSCGFRETVCSSRKKATRLVEEYQARIDALLSI